MVQKEFLVSGAIRQRHKKLSEPNSPSSIFFSSLSEGGFFFSVLLLTSAHLPEWILSCFLPTLLTNND